MKIKHSWMAMAVAGFSATVSAGQGMAPGLYEFRGVVNVQGTPGVGPQTFAGKQCLTEKDLADGGQKAFSSGPSDKNPCVFSNYQTTGNSARWNLRCDTQGMVSTGGGTASFTSTSYTVNSDTVTEMMGMRIVTNTQLNGSRVADCSESSFQTATAPAAAAAPSAPAAAPAAAPASNGSSGMMNLGMGLGATAAAFTGNAGAMSKIAEAQQLMDKVGTLKGLAASASASGKALPNPRGDSQGEFVLPYKSDGTVSPWAEKALTASAAGAASNVAAGKATDVASQQLAAKVPFGGLVGGLFGKKAKEKAQEVGAVMAIGGWDFIRTNSNLSFDNVDAMAVYMNAQYGTRTDFPQALASAIAVYPTLKDRYEPAVKAHYGQ